MYEKILVLGRGAREHVILEKLLISIIYGDYESHIDLYTYNFEIRGFVNSINYDLVNNLSGGDNIDSILQTCLTNKIDLVIVSQEHYLVEGIVDKLAEIGIACFGPTKEAAQIEGSKLFAKEVMLELDIPTANFEFFIDFELCCNYLRENFNYNVIKVSGLAAGKGVFLPNSLDEALSIVSDIMINKKFGKAGDILIIEERLYGEEISVMGFCNGKDIELMPQAQDYKRIFDGNNGPNTGGMGAICPVNILSDDEMANIKKDMKKIVSKLKYVGVLYVGIIKTSNQYWSNNDSSYYVLEYNCRFGDPEAQVILNCLDIKYNNLLNIITECLKKRRINIKWTNEIVANIVVSNDSYPDAKLVEDVEIEIPELNPDILFYYGNIRYGEIYNSEIYNLMTNGGRILSVVKKGHELFTSLHILYNYLPFITFKDSNMTLPYYRRDIGLNLLKENTFIKQKSIQKPISIAILGSTNGTSCEKLLELNNSSIYPGEVKIIVSNKKNAGILDKARNHNISYLYFPTKKNETTEEYDKKLVDILRTYKIDMVLLVGYMRIVSKVLIDEYSDNIINIHPSLLPAYSGMMDMNIHEAVLQNNDKIAGCTLHIVNEKIDAGRILLQSQLVVGECSNPQILKQKIQELEAECIINYIQIAGNFNIAYEVSIENANRFTELLKKKNEKIGSFCALVDIGNIKFGMACDGVGTKLKIADAYNRLDTIGIDLVAMCVNDLLACGVKPMYFLDYIAIDKLDVEKCNTIVESIKNACGIAKCELIGGETAEMKGIYRKDAWDMAGFALGMVENLERDLMPKLSEINEECLLYGIASNGIHSNGYTLIDKLITKSDSADVNIEEILKPTRIYMEILEILCYYDNLLACAHITGGGIHDNLIRVIPENLTYELEKWELPPLLNGYKNRVDFPRGECCKLLIVE